MTKVLQRSGFPTSLSFPTVGLRHIVDCLDGQRIPVEAQYRLPGPIPYWGAGTIQDYVDKFIFNEPLILLGEDGAPFDDATRNVAHYSEGEIWVNNHMHVLRPHEGVNARFLTYALNCVRYSEYLSGAIIPKLTQSQMMSIRVPFPGLEIQDAIVTYLNNETAKIDHLIAKQRELIELLHLRNEARWHAAFTGFTPVKTRPLKRLLVKLRRPVVEGSGVVTAFRDGEVTLRSNRREEGFTFSEAETGYQGVAVGDLVFHGLDGFAGAVGISDSDGQSTPVYHVCRLRNNEDNLRFIAYLLRYLGYSGFLSTQAPSVRQRAVDFRNWQTFGQIPLSLPGPEEQQRIVTELDKNAKEVLNTETTIERAIELLQERRSTLITAAVTGQIEV